MPNINDLLSQHVTLDLECLDRIYLNGYVPQLQTPEQLVHFLRNNGGNKVPSPALLGRLTQAFVRAVESFATEHSIPVVPFEKQRKDDLAADYHKHFSKPEGVVFIGVAQEKAYAFKAQKRTDSGFINFDYSRQKVFVKHYYFYLRDQDFGPAFIKVCTYAPFPIKVCLNGHEWAKQQLHQEAIPFQSLDNGFLSCADPQRLQIICDQLGPQQIQSFFDKWLQRLPLPLTPEHQQLGYRHRLSVWQMEMSRTMIFDRPLNGRQFFEEVIRENIDLGRPDRVQLLFQRKVTSRTPGNFRTRVINRGVSPSLYIEYKSSSVKQYFKEGRGLRNETTINDPHDFDLGKDISNLPKLQDIARQINRRLLEVERLSHNCILSQENVDDVVQPAVTRDGQRAPGLRFGDPRVMALFAALILFAHLADGLTNKALRQYVAGFLSPDYRYTPAKMTYDLRRLRLKGLIQRLPHTNHYLLTTYGRRVSLFFTKLDSRVFRPAFASIHSVEDIPRPLANALATVDKQIEQIFAAANISSAA